MDSPRGCALPFGDPCEWPPPEAVTTAWDRSRSPRLNLVGATCAVCRAPQPKLILASRFDRESAFEIASSSVILPSR